MRIGIIGAGISGLTAGSYLRGRYPHGTAISIFEGSNRVGGRIFTKIITINGSTYHLDIGANLIDFNQKQEQSWKQLMKPSIQNSLRELIRPFLIHEKGQLERGNSSNPKYYYQGGFPGFIEAMRQDNEDILYLDKKVSKIVHDSNHYCLHFLDGQTQLFDKIVFAIPSPHIKQIIEKSPTIKDPYVLALAKSVGYTKQISVTFLVELPHQFSCILFKKHPVLSFICSHEQKYGENSVVAQLSQQFSQKYFDQSAENIHQMVYDSIRESLPQKITETISRDFVYVHKWEVSLVKPETAVPEKQWNEGTDIFVIGDCVPGKSRVTGSIASVKALDGIGLHKSNL